MTEKPANTPTIIIYSITKYKDKFRRTGRNPKKGPLFATREKNGVYFKSQ